MTCLVLTSVIYGCRKDLGRFGKTAAADALAQHGVNLGLLQNAYRAGTSVQQKVNSVSPANLSRIIGTLNVDWATYTLFTNPDSSQLVEFDMPDDNSLLIPDATSIGDSSKYHAKTKAVFIVRKDTVRLSFFMKAIEDGTAAGYQPVLGQVHYKRIPLGFTGKILYFTLGRQFINGYRWNNGGISNTLSISAPVTHQLQTQSTGDN